MLISITYIVFFGLIGGYLCKKIKFPSLFGMILAGILIGPHVLNLIDSSVLNISAEIRKIALIIILIRAGLKLSIEDLKKVGRPAILMCFFPAMLEVIGMVLLAPKLLGITILEAAILGSVIGAVSPAVIVPRMIKLIDDGYGTNKGIPQMILAGASVDDVFVIVLFTTFTALAQGGSVSVKSFIDIPISIIVGIAVGLLAGYVLVKYFQKFHMRDSVKVIIILGVSFALTYIEDTWSYIIPFAALIAVMALGLMIKRQKQELATKLSKKYDKLWVVAEIFLFVLVGASVKIESLETAGLSAIILIIGVLIFRMIGVFVCVMGTSLDSKERLFCMLAYTPKATVQAAIGGLPLAMGLACGNIVLTVSVIAILLTAPLGAFAIDLTYRKFLGKEELILKGDSENEMPTVMRAEEEWQRTGAYSVRIQGMNRQHDISLREEFDEHDTDGTKYIVLIDKKYPIATCRFYELSSNEISIGRVVVLPEYRGMQYGRYMIGEAEKWAKELGYTSIRVESRIEAVGFYEKLGYILESDEIIDRGVFLCKCMTKTL